MNLSAFAHLDWSRRCLVVGAFAGMVMTLALLGAFFGSHWVPDWGLAPTEKRTLELLPFVLVGGAAFIVGTVAFVAAAVLSLVDDRPASPVPGSARRAASPPARPVAAGRRRKTSPASRKNSG